MKKDKRGISLIVLVITIILMIILGTTVILSLSGENTIKRTREAKVVSDLSSIVERVKLVIAQKQLEGINMTEGEYTLGDFGIESEYNRYIVIKDGQIYTNMIASDSFVELAKKANISNILPSEYTKVQYIESKGAQYIDTGVFMDNKTIINILYFKRVKNVDWQMYLGTKDEDSRIVLQQYSTRNEFFYSIDTDELHITDNSEYQIIINNNEFTTIDLNSDEKIIETLNSDITKKENALYLFCNNSKGRAVQFSHIRLGEIRFDKEGRALKDFIPCYCNSKVTDVNGNECLSGTAGMYDLVEGKFYTNQGTGEFAIPTEQ